MKQISLRIKVGLAALLLPTLATGCSSQVSEQGNSARATNVEANAGEPTEKAPGVIVHIDPKTGEIITPPKGVPGEVPQPPVDTTKKPQPELRQVPSPVPGGGVIIELDERFQTPLTATMDPDGNVKLEHKRATDSDDKKNK